MAKQPDAPEQTSAAEPEKVHHHAMRHEDENVPHRLSCAAPCPTASNREDVFGGGNQTHVPTKAEVTHMVRAVQSPPNSTRQDVTVITDDSAQISEDHYVLLRAFWPADLCSQQFLDEEEYAELCLADESSRAAIKGADLLQLRDHAKNGLRDKLCRRGFSMEAAQAAVNYLESRGVLRERELLVRTMQYDCDVKHWGPTRIRAHLIANGFDLHKNRATYEETLQGLDFISVCQKRLERMDLKQIFTPKGRQKQTAALMRQGFYLAHIRAAMEQIQQDMDENGMEENTEDDVFFNEETFSDEIE